MRGLLNRPKMSFTDGIASRFAFWIINRKGPPDDLVLRDLERERKRHLARLSVEIAFYLTIGLAMLAFFPEWWLVIIALVAGLSIPKMWQLGRDYIATPTLLQPANRVEGLLDEVEKARQQSETVAQYYREIEQLKRPILRIEAIAMATVPRLNEKDWLE
ncbi:hypothetical protein CAI21_04405 [Alkalilimnicola ehrlichii]|uniref:Uncharacterized protein n=1 Tax=Alkalilimnicola ehrlichii TaxID=351052 RepID=A0A3E0X1Y3_9GAMM|nr:hypothetical protein [Alkalilimnicola ehrlichii]RFA30756.1 hypothetical protein CAI21_04405 [Alkalilimnicola ehrlichii]RFA38332.1 hypothetical protein CAL65_05770 [Alkalilimnicola ehrlichii]